MENYTNCFIQRENKSILIKIVIDFFYCKELSYLGLRE